MVMQEETIKAYVRAIKPLIQNGSLSPEARSKLESYRKKLNLSAAEAASIENRVLDFLANHPPSETRPDAAPNAPLSTDGGSSVGDSGTADRPASAIELSPSVPIKAPSPDPSFDDQTNLQRYEQEFRQAIRDEYPLSAPLRHQLSQCQQALKLSDADVEAIESRVMQSFQPQSTPYQANLHHYEQAFSQALAQGFPLNPEAQHYLFQLQQQLNLRSEDVLPIEGQILALWLNKHPSHFTDSQGYAFADAAYPASAPTLLPSLNLQPPISPSKMPRSPIVDVQLLDQQPLDQQSLDQQPLDQQSLNQPFVNQPPPVREVVVPPKEAVTPTIDASPINLATECNIDYSRLYNLLQANQWKQADEETLIVLLQATDRLDQGWLDVEALEDLPYTDLHTIDRLWLRFSRNRFGFSAQLRVYSNQTVPRSIAIKSARADYDLALQFCKQVGWWFDRFQFLKYYHMLDFSDKAPYGHLPAYWFWSAPWWKTIQQGGIGSGRGGCGIDTLMISAWMKHLQTCGFK